MIDYELNMYETLKDNNDIDVWGCAYAYVGDEYGAEYNYCVDNGENYSAIYLMEKEDSGFWETDPDCYIHYEIEWDKEDWEKRLENKMKDFIKQEMGKRNSVIKNSVDTCKNNNMRIKELEVFEVAFILGYDLLHHAFATSEHDETDLVYNACLEIAEDFVNSSFDRTDKGLYTCVCEYLTWSEEFEKFKKKFGIYY